ncbi:hypothetical protein XENOCAPTIV_004245, partial [Xenoophorus captivus]
ADRKWGGERGKDVQHRSGGLGLERGTSTSRTEISVCELRVLPLRHALRPRWFIFSDQLQVSENVSRRSLGKMLLSSLESGSNPQHGKAHILEVLNALYHELAACEILSSDGALQKTQSQQSLHDLIFYC